MPQSTRKVGGVSPSRRAGPAAAATGPQHGDFVYNGGPVITCPLIFATFWGSHWSDAAHQAQSARLIQFLKDLVGSTWMNIMSQYGAGSGPNSGMFIHSSFVSNVPANLTDASIHTVIQNAINSGAIPEPPASNATNVIVIFLDESTAVNDPGLGVVMCEPTSDNAFGYHYFFTTAKGNNCYYAVIPALDDTCINNTCPGGAGCSLSLAETQEQRRTQVTSHEFAEMITDPQFPTGWFGPSSDENGDICNGETATITVGPNTWNVQRIYSKTDDIATNGASFCLASAPSPIPKLAGGPAAVATMPMVSPERFGAFKGFLPLPTAHFDAAAGTASFDEDHVHKFARQFFYPLHHSNVVGNMPAALRQFADILEKSNK
jgi:hypothetical protein